MNPILTARQLTKRYGSRTVVDGVGLNVRRGEVYGFLGRNGAGKTTTIRMLTGLIEPTQGKIEIFGEDLFRHKRDILRRIGAIVEVPGFYENLTGAENLAINARIMGIHKRDAIPEALEIVGLRHETGKLVGKYSLGMKQRLGIARALLHYPELLILDEPTNGLDPIGIKEMRGLIKSLAAERNITVFLSSHILSEIEQLADRVGIIHDGRLLEETSLEELRRLNRRYAEFRVSSDSKAVRILEREFKIRDYEARGDGRIRIYSHIGEVGRINRALVEHDVEVTGISLSEDRLEDYFTRLVGGGGIG